jgi:hypothetical protein
MVKALLTVRGKTDARLGNRIQPLAMLSTSTVQLVKEGLINTPVCGIQLSSKKAAAVFVKAIVPISLYCSEVDWLSVERLAEIVTLGFGAAA